ncbi:MAG TPA: hypothetical protein VHT74_31595 [Acetobacteraceae bacterium]|jgi:hypothetical protein|nr:hypothetical protein [Acetobacteraceae bacterium]
MRTGRQTLWGEADDAWAAVPSTVPMPATIVRPRPAPGINEVQLDPSTYGTADTISGFRLGTDSLDFAGYASAVSAMAQVTQEWDGHGGSLLALSDGTRIDLAGIGQVTSGAFV